MQGILLEIGEALKKLQLEGTCTITSEENFESEEVLHYIEDVLNGLKAAFITTFSEDRKTVHIKLV